MHQHIKPTHKTTDNNKQANLYKKVDTDMNNNKDSNHTLLNLFSSLVSEIQSQINTKISGHTAHI